MRVRSSIEKEKPKQNQTDNSVSGITRFRIEKHTGTERKKKNKKQVYGFQGWRFMGSEMKRKHRIFFKKRSTNKQRRGIPLIEKNGGDGKLIRG